MDNKSPTVKEFQNVRSRINSFKKFDTRRASPQTLASAGFYFLGVKDNVQCFHCGLQLRNWNAKDDPWKEHAKWSPNCSFIKSMQITDNKTPELQNDKNKVPQYQDSSKRLATLKGAPISVSMSTMAEAGFFLFKKDSDHVKCFSCGIQLHKWQKGEDPWAEHAKASPKCSHVLTVKGGDFFQKVVNKEYSKDEDPETDTHDSRDVILSPQPTVSDLQHVMAAVTLQDDALTTPYGDDVLTGSIEIEVGCKRMEETMRTQPIPQGDRESALLQENRQLKERIQCKVCCEEDVKVVFLPCGHLVACGQCAPAVKKCPLCRNDISATISVNLPGS